MQMSYAWLVTPLNRVDVDGQVTLCEIGDKIMEEELGP